MLRRILHSFKAPCPWEMGQVADPLNSEEKSFVLRTKSCLLKDFRDLKFFMRLNVRSLLSHISQSASN